MENNPGDSSSESDTADPWSIIDRDSCEPEGIPVDYVLKDRDSGETSDGESLEVIGEEEKHENEYKDADMETDGISIISESESEGRNEVEQPISLVVSKEKKYLHHPNTYLNTRLNVLLALSFAAVTGLGLGHFLGLQEECPLLNESATNLLTKLQHDNRLLQYKIEELLTEKDAAARLFKQIQDRECGTDMRFRSEGRLHLHPSLQAGIHEHPLNLEICGFHATVIGSEQHTSDSRNEYKDEVRNVAKQSPVMRVERVLVDESAEYAIPINYEEEIAVKPPYVGKKEGITSDPDSKYGVLTNAEGPLTAANMQPVERNSVTDFTDHVDDVTFEQFTAHDNFAKLSVELNGEGNIKESYDLVNKHKAVADVPLVMKDEKYSEVFSVQDDRVAQPAVPVQDKGFMLPVKDRDIVLEHTVTIHSSGGDTSAEVNRNEDSPQPEVIEATYGWKENNIEIIKSILKLLQTQYNDIAPTDTGKILSSSIALATEVEQSMVHLQDTITECEVQKTDFCAQFQEKVEVSVTKLKETAEGLVDDIDEQLYKLVSKIVRKLKKFKGKLRDKWCHLTDTYAYDSDAIYNWLHSSVLLDCKESDKRTRRRFNQYPAKELYKLNDKLVRSTSGENQKGTLKGHDAKEEYDFKSVDLNTASEVDKENNIPVSQFHISNKQRSSKVVINHDSLNEQNIKINTPVTVPEETGKFTRQEQYMSQLQKKLKHDNGGTFKRHFNGKEKTKHENIQKCVHKSKTDQDCDDDHWYDKNNRKAKFNDKKKKEYKKREIEHSWRNENRHHKRSVILEQHASWILHDTNTPKQRNVSGDWILKMASDRAEQRKLEHRSDWVFDRADARKLKREKQHLTDNWYFERVRGREYCRYYPHSDWCKTGTYSGPNYDWFHQRDHENENPEEGRIRHGPRLTNKFIPRSFAAARKLIKDYFTYFQHKMNYHSHR